ncbi:hypothetical protein QAD02_022316 [Eretmocerus hayati]|uniref:Uncharacterized protein n=1 Tax=Eretmocerus hayati TaxID=131215 RepID=A0ACC2PSX1_9HYME|nr:hypothetical protein QAD02_022316 [Eretmocerus hayati]
MDEGKHRRISITCDATPIGGGGVGGQDNLGFEAPRSGQQSPARRKSLLSLHPPHSSSENLHHINSFGARINHLDHLDARHHLQRKKSAFSLSSSIRDKVEYTEELER